ncbi:MAG: leucine-rich repeat domain-containing protein [Ruminococcaceae bacterium]|nr:leucine-rich repeat domain-containing protein [Oscillospiraceae bacterium]
MKRNITLFALVLVSLICVLCACGNKSGFTYTKVEGGIAITGYTGENMDMVIPTEINGKKVVEIASKAFDTALIKTAVVPETVTKIGNYAFRRCPNLVSIEIKGNIKEISDGMFNFCPLLKEITIPDGVERIGNNAFGGGAITSIDLPDSVKTIDDYAFYSCKSLTSFKAGKNLEKIGNNSFAGCIALKDISLNQNLKEIGEYAFSYCTAIESIQFPESVKKLSMGVLSGTNITEMYVSNGVTTIDAYAFSVCEKLEKIYIPKNVEEINYEAFNDTRKITIYGVSDSEAEIFADTYGYKFQKYDFSVN